MNNHLPSTILKQLIANQQKAFIAYIAAGDPNLAATETYIRALARGGADIIELGVPFTDPMADGPINQMAAQRALASKTNLDGIFDLVEKLRSEGVQTPFVLFTYLNPLYAYGLEKFCERAATIKLGGLLILDLPVEAASIIKPKLDEAQVETVFLASPTTDPKRIKLIDQQSSAFVYYVSRAGVTGVQSSLSNTLEAELIILKQNISAPLAVGFGISEAQHVKAVVKHADAVIVGSALVKIIAEGGDAEQVADKLENFVRELCTGLEDESC